MWTFVIPCKFDPTNPMVFSCINSIKIHHPDARIVVVDSDSDDKGYMANLDVDHKVYGSGYSTPAYKWAYDNLVSDNWGLIHDNLIIKSTIPEPNPVLTARYFLSSHSQCDWGEDESGEYMKYWAERAADFDVPEDFIGVFGPIWFCTQEVMDDLKGIGVLDIPVKTKMQMCSLERLIGIALQELGYDPTVSLQGEMSRGWDGYDNSVVEKHYAGRL